MAELDPNDRNREMQAQAEEEKKPSYTPASVEKRIAAWMGLGYALMLLFVVTFSIFTGGKELPGTFPLLLLPVCAATAALAVYRCRKKASSLLAAVFVVAVCAFGVLLGLALGVPALCAALRSAYP